MTEIVPFDPWTLVLIGLLNPAVIAVAIYLGRRADQGQKLPVAAFIASCAGIVLYWLAAQVGLIPVHALGGEAGVFVVQFIAGLAWAAIAFWAWPASSRG